MPKSVRAILVLICALCFPLDAAAAAATSTYETPSTILEADYVFDVAADGTYTLDLFSKMRVNNQQGVQGMGHAPLPFSTTLQQLDVLEAYTTTKEGKRIDVTADRILLQQSPQSTGAPIFDDVKVKNIVFSNVEVGAVLNIRVRMRQIVPQFPGNFSVNLAFPRTSGFRLARVTLRTPESMKLNVDAIDLPGGEIQSDKAGTRMWRWTLENPILHMQEPGSVAATDFSPRIAVSSFPDYAAAAQAYWARAKPKAVVTPAIQKLADQITDGLADKRAQAEALYRWVSKEIRYVGIFLGFGGVVPHSADEIALARYGDCKDHVTILEALLAAKGIKSSPVLVNNSDSYWLPKVAVTPGQFNHMISYLPDFKLYVDSTAGLAPFGVLPAQELGKKVLVIDDGSGQPRIDTLPLADTQRDRVKVVTKVEVTADGTIKGDSSIVNTGIYELIARQQFSRVAKGTEERIAAQALSLLGRPGTGTFKYGDARDLTRPFGYTTEFDSPNVVPMPGPGAMRVPAGLGSASGIVAITNTLGQAKREFPFAVMGGAREEVTTVSFPATTKITALPKPVVKENSMGKYTSTYTLDGATVTVNRILERKLTKPTIDPDEYPLYRELADAVARDFRAQILFQ